MLTIEHADNYDVISFNLSYVIFADKIFWNIDKNSSM